MISGKTYFVSGIDTDAGKTYATGHIAATLIRHGANPVTVKLIQTGCASGEISEDILSHRRIMGTGLFDEDKDFTTCPLRFSYPCSPHLAARMDGRDINLSVVDEAVSGLALRYDTILIEGAGGLMVPVKENYLMADYAAERNLPVILVTNPRLGSINHTLLSLYYCRTRGLEVAALAFNLFPETSPQITEDTRDFLRRYIAANLPGTEFVEVPFME